jgi:flagellar basal body rod protein FlgG
MTDPILRIGQSGLETTEEKVKSLTNKMVNAETPGFKGSEILVRSFPLELQAAEKRLQSEEPKVEGTFYNHLHGSLIRTANPTDLALGSDGFFTVLCPWGEGYTRDGRFTLDAEGRLVSTVGNYPLMGQNGPIIVTPGTEIEISQLGDVKAGKTLVDRIRVVDFPAKQNLESVNGTIFRDASGQLEVREVDSPRIVQGYVEASNVSVIDSMMEMIYLSRIYNLDAKIISTRDTSMSRAIEMGKVQ